MRSRVWLRCFPDDREGGFYRRGAHGDGRVCAKNDHVGYSSMMQATVGLQIGGAGYSEIVFLQD